MKKLEIFYWTVNEALSNKLKSAIHADEVWLTDGVFFILEGIDEPIRLCGEIPLMKGLWLILKSELTTSKVLDKKNIHQPTYGEVFKTLSTKEVHQCFVAYELLCMRANKFSIEAANKFLKDIAAKYAWDYSVFMDIIDEEYDVLYWK